MPAGGSKQAHQHLVDTIGAHLEALAAAADAEESAAAPQTHSHSLLLSHSCDLLQAVCTPAQPSGKPCRLSDRDPAINVQAKPGSGQTKLQSSEIAITTGMKWQCFDRNRKPSPQLELLEVRLRYCLPLLLAAAHANLLYMHP